MILKKKTKKINKYIKDKSEKNIKNKNQKLAFKKILKKLTYSIFK